ncbi:ribosome maturation factor RimP [Mumia sp. ZJ1417]|uniref:ribosome maturation factor RimP n=1 Tax=Mumia sp. ZJ1417 TaxID=2708082 RepID=UPI001424963F|nr:ribosome maturation factor RimP [Mumia sp. ZJ1417]QMW65026.1 ribosome maturation factor RimP [Mumia sp. ZJ1417]
MATTPVPDTLRQALDEVVTSHGMDLDAVELTGGRVLRVVVDAENALNLDDIAKVTRAVSTALDDTNDLGSAPYTLEVSTRGTSRPLTLPRHWSRNVDRWVKVTPAEGDVFEGRILSADDAGAVIRTETGERDVAYEDVKKAKIEPELKRKDV